jgi:hypothetical protein
MLFLTLAVYQEESICSDLEEIVEFFCARVITYSHYSVLVNGKSCD